MLRPASTCASFRSYLCKNFCSRVPIKDASNPGETVNVSGWVKSVRKQKELVFIELNDGSTARSLQVVVPADKFPGIKAVSQGWSLSVSGDIVRSPAKSQPVELRPASVTVLGECDPRAYPFKARTHHGLDYTRQFPHLRPRTQAFAAMLRVRSTASAAVHRFFQGRGFLHLHTPILTSSDCEGAGNMFAIKPANGFDNGEEFFNSKAYLTVSGQLHAEAVACAMSSVYTFGPTFRAERSHTRRHLAEFYMVEAELTTPPGDLVPILEVIEGLCKHVTRAVLEERGEDVELFHKAADQPEVKTYLMTSLEKPYRQITYREGMEILLKAHQKSPFAAEPRPGADLSSEHEQFLVAHCGHLPLFVTEFPAAIKPFYMRAVENSTSAAAVDLLMPLVGEVVGGSLREERYHVLQERLQRLGTSDSYQWYLDLRRFGTVPHGGFGLGFERLLQSILGADIRDVILFPRYLGSCPM